MNRTPLEDLVPSRIRTLSLSFADTSYGQGRNVRYRRSGEASQIRQGDSQSTGTLMFCRVIIVFTTENWAARILVGSHLKYTVGPCLCVRRYYNAARSGGLPIVISRNSPEARLKPTAYNRTGERNVFVSSEALLDVHLQRPDGSICHT